jgi:hypothetical protein
MEVVLVEIKDLNKWGNVGLTYEWFIFWSNNFVPYKFLRILNDL